MNADGGSIFVKTRARLATCVAELPMHVEALRHARGQNDAEIAVTFGDDKIFIGAGVEIDQVVRQLAQRCSQFEQVIKQAEDIGLKIRRTPYDEHIRDIAETGIVHVVLHGFGHLKREKLIFFPDRREFRVRGSVSDNAFRVTSIPGATGPLN